MEFIILAIVFVAVIIIITKANSNNNPPRNERKRPTKPSPVQKTPSKPISQPLTNDKSSFNRFGYNAYGKNEKGQYNRFYDTQSFKEEGFYSPQLYPIALTDHARERMYERLDLHTSKEMMINASNAYKYGKSKRQIKKTSAGLIDDIEQRYNGSKVLIYQNHVYIFTENNVLITVYKNYRIPL